MDFLLAAGGGGVEFSVSAGRDDDVKMATAAITARAKIRYLQPGSNRRGSVMTWKEFLFVSAYLSSLVIIFLPTANRLLRTTYCLLPNYPSAGAPMWATFSQWRLPARNFRTP